jgi:G:T-mismatch repair DNA endonuclease (very short patch repair protein)
MLKPKQCLQCNKSFSPRVATAKYCSKSCQVAARTKYPRFQKPCDHCGKIFTVDAPNVKYCSADCRCRSSRKHDLNHICEHCGKDFVAHVPTAKFCSRTCKGLASRKYHYQHNCPECSKVFTVTDGVERIYCSNKCAGFAKAKVRRVTEWKARVNLTCAHCKKEFSTPPSQIGRKGRGTYCCKKCADNAKVGMPGNRPIVPRLLYNCATCGKEWMDYASKKNRKKFCSKTCRSIAVIQGLSGKTTAIERETYAALKTLNLEFEPQYRICYKVVDAFLPSLNTVIECLGDYFHCNPEIYPNGPINAMQTKNMTDDKRRFSTFKTKGYTVIKLWEKDIKEHGALKLLSKLLPKG